MTDILQKSEEQAILALRALYSKYGYLAFKMSKFEEYELYIRNKDFLVSDRIITFNDTNGKLLALKPDVTLSIIKQGEDTAGVKQKVYYNENVYRVSESTGHYKEIMQSGVECIGDIDLYDIFEVLSLASQSLELISDSYMLEISHLGIVSAILDELDADQSFRRQAIHYISEKNAHDLARLCKEYGADDALTAKLTALVTIYGKRSAVISALEPICTSPAALASLSELKQLSALLDTVSGGDRVIFDFSVINDMSYYNGIVFKGFIDGICDGVLAGGQYDKMMHKMGRRAGAIGFALYLDLLEQLRAPAVGYDVDVLVLYDSTTPLEELSAKVSELVASGKRVSAQRAVPENLRYRECLSLKKEASKC